MKTLATLLVFFAVAGCAWTPVPADEHRSRDEILTDAMKLVRRGSPIEALDASLNKHAWLAKHRLPVSNLNLLHYAVVQNRPDAVTLLLKRGADPDFGLRPGFTPLYFAALQNKMEVAKALVAGGADVNLRVPNGEIEVRNGVNQKCFWRGPLDCAAASGHLEMAKYLIDQGAIVTGTSNGYTPLHAACEGPIEFEYTKLPEYRGNRKMIEFLESKGCDINKLSKSPARSPLSCALAQAPSYRAVFDYLITREDVDVNLEISPARGTALDRALSLPQFPDRDDVIAKLRARGAMTQSELKARRDGGDSKSPQPSTP